jgi:hypothetical protein
VSKQERVPGGSSYGYRVIRQLLADGSVSSGEREIDPSQAAIIQRIFKEYADGMAPRQIAARLNREAVPSPRGGQWNASTINGNRRRRIGILNNELYLGRILYNRQRFLKDPESGKRIARPNPEHEWATKEVLNFASLKMTSGNGSKSSSSGIRPDGVTSGRAGNGCSLAC